MKIEIEIIIIEQRNFSIAGTHIKKKIEILKQKKKVHM